MGLYLLSHSLREFLRFRRIWGWVALCLGSGAITAVWPYVIHNLQPRQEYADLSSMLAFHLVPLAAAIMVTAIVGQEVEQRTIVYLLTRPVSRWKLLLSKYVSACLVTAGVGILCALVISGVIFHNPFHNDLLWADVVAMFLGAFAYGALFLFFSLIVVKSLIPCMLFFVWEVSVSNMQGDIYRLAIFSYMEGIAQHPAVDQQRGVAFFTGSMSNNLLMPAQSYPVLIGMAVVLTAVSLWWFTKFEFVPREDAD